MCVVLKMTFRAKSLVSLENILRALEVLKAIYSTVNIVSDE